MKVKYQILAAAGALLMAAVAAAPASASPYQLDELLAGVADPTAQDFIVDHWREGWHDGQYWWVNGVRYTPSQYRNLLIARSAGALAPPGADLRTDPLPDPLPAVTPPDPEPAETKYVYRTVPVYTAPPSYYSDTPVWRDSWRDPLVYLGIGSLVGWGLHHHHRDRGPKYHGGHRPPPPPPAPHRGGPGPRR